MYTEYRPVVSSDARVSTPLFWEGIWAQAPGPSERSRAVISGDEIWREMASRLPARARMLDAGCGLGEWVDFLNSKGHRAVGLDYSSKTVERNRQACPDAEWYCGTIQEMPFPSGHFDGVISLGIVEHDEAGPQRALREFHRVLAPDGYLFVTVPLDSPWMRHASRIQFPDGPGPRGFFQYFFAPEELRAVVTEAQFEVETVIPVSPNPLPVLFPRVYRLVHPWRRWKVEGLCRRAAHLLTSDRRKACGMCLVIARKRGTLSAS